MSFSPRAAVAGLIIRAVALVAVLAVGARFLP